MNCSAEKLWHCYCCFFIIFFICVKLQCRRIQALLLQFFRIQFTQHDILLLGYLAQLYIHN